MADSEDELTGPEAFAASQGWAASEADEDEEQDYGASEQEEDDAYEEGEDVGAPSAEEDEENHPSTPSAQPAKEKLPETPETAKRYIFCNKVAHLIPQSALVRDRGGAFEVDSPEHIRELTSKAKNWPKPAEFHPLSICVVKGRFAEDEICTRDDGVAPPYCWYMRFAVRGKPDSVENRILRLMPRAVVRETLRYYAMNLNLRRSSLIMKYPPRDDNNKPLPMALNGFEKAPHIYGRPMPPVESDSEDEYDQHEGERGTWMMRCHCGNEWCIDMWHESDPSTQCCGNETYEDYEHFFHKRPRPTRKERARNMRLFLGLSICKMGSRRWRLRAAERAYAPGANGYKDAKVNYEDTQRRRSLLTGF